MMIDTPEILDAFRHDIPLSESQLHGVLDFVWNNPELKESFLRERAWDRMLADAFAEISVPPRLNAQILQNYAKTRPHD